MAATQAKLGKGTILRVGDGASPESYTAIPEILEISGSPGGTPDEISVYNHDSPTFWDELLTGKINPKTITVRANWQKGGASANTVALALQTQMESGAAKNFQIVIPTTAPETITFSARIVDFQVITPVNAQMEVNFSLKSTGTPVWT